MEKVRRRQEANSEIGTIIVVDDVCDELTGGRLGGGGKEETENFGQADKQS